VGASSWNANVAHDTVTEADASESMIPLSNVFRNRITPEPYTTENRSHRLYLNRASNLVSVMTPQMLRDQLQRRRLRHDKLYQGVQIYFQNVVRFRGTMVDIIPPTAVRNNSTHGHQKSTAFSALIFTKLNNSSIALYAHLF